MRAFVQRVSRAKVTLKATGEISGEIGPGLLVLLGVGQNDTEKEVRLMARKIATMRVFDDAEGRMNLEPADLGAKILVVSQFTLFADCKRGKRPGFTEAAPSESADKLYRLFVEEIRTRWRLTVETGQFQTDMAVELVNDGPVTIWLDTDFL